MAASAGQHNCRSHPCYVHAHHIQEVRGMFRTLMIATYSLAEMVQLRRASGSAMAPEVMGFTPLDSQPQSIIDQFLGRKTA